MTATVWMVETISATIMTVTAATMKVKATIMTVTVMTVTSAIMTATATIMTVTASIMTVTAANPERRPRNTTATSAASLLREALEVAPSTPIFAVVPSASMFGAATADDAAADAMRRREEKTKREIDKCRAQQIRFYLDR